MTVIFLGIAFSVGHSGSRRNEVKEEIREALQEWNDFIGQWKGIGSLTGSRITGWRESADWSWRFKGDDLWLRLKVIKGKFLKGGELRYDPKSGEYQFTLIDKDKNQRVFRGKKKGKRLVLLHTDPKTKDVHKIEMNNAANGIRFVYTYHVKPANRTLFYQRFQVGYTKEGESFATAKKKIECVVTGGLGTIPVTYNGVTYYVCCSGCRDAFLADPEKIIAEYKKRKRGR